MPICYQIEIDITRNRDGEEPYATTLPFAYKSENGASGNDIDNAVSEYWGRFASMLGDTAPDQGKQYSWAGGYRILSIFNC